MVDSHGALFVADAYNHTIRRGVLAIALQVALAGNQVVLSWPATPGGFLLEKSTAVSPPDSWETVREGTALIGGRYVVTNSPQPGSAFFRLRR